MEWLGIGIFCKDRAFIENSSKSSASSSEHQQAALQQHGHPHGKSQKIKQGVDVEGLRIEPQMTNRQQGQ
jgi:hypothetical protein